MLHATITIKLLINLSRLEHLLAVDAAKMSKEGKVKGSKSKGSGERLGAVAV